MPNKKNQGSALLLTTILLFVVLSMVVSLSYVTVMEQKMSQKTKSSVGSFFNADSGVEWALNQIANTSNPDTTTVQSKFTLAANGNKTCPFGGCDIYFLKANGDVITQSEANSLYVSDIKAVRSVGTQTAGEPTQRAIEAAVAAGSCPSGYTDAGDYCIETAEHTGGTKTWFAASVACQIAGAQLCENDQWNAACTNLSLTDEVDDWEWVNHYDGSNSMGYNTCDSDDSKASPRTTLVAYRCCAHKE